MQVLQQHMMYRQCTGWEATLVLSDLGTTAGSQHVASCADSLLRLGLALMCPEQGAHVLILQDLFLLEPFMQDIF